MRGPVHRVLAVATAAATAVALGVTIAPSAGAATTADASLAVGRHLSAGSSITAGAYRLSMQTDGNLVLYHGSTALFASNTNRTGAHNYAVFQSDGNFVVYNSANTYLWKSATNRSGATRATLQTDGNFVIYKGSTALWATGTYGGYSELENSKVYSKALAMVGKYPYEFGAGHGSKPGPTDGGRMDCSGMVRWAYYLASGKDIMDGATNQQIDLANHKDGRHAPGELIFYSDTGSTNNTHHVGVYGGDGHLINEWDTGHDTLINGVDDSSGTQFKYYWRSW